MSNALPDTEHVTVATFEHRSAGEALTAYLVSHGISARLRDEHGLQRWWFLSPSHAAIHVDVPGGLAEAARRRIRKWEPRGKLPGRMVERPLFCPECGQSRIQYPNMTRHFLLPTLIAHVLTVLRIIDPECYCEDCHHTWTPARIGHQRRIRAVAPAKSRVPEPSGGGAAVGSGLPEASPRCDTGD